MRIFLSSTYVDLADHRKSVDNIINRLAHQFRGMEYFGSREFEPKSVCFKEIAECDLFIGVYAHRYGWVPEGDDASITEQEYDFANSSGIPCLLYIVDEEHPWNPKFIERDDAASKLSLFKNNIQKFVISKFTSPDNLAKQVASDIGRRIERQTSLQHNINEVCEILSKLIVQDIKTSIGPKYIPDLYVKRSLSRRIKNRIANYGGFSKSIRQLAESAEKISIDLVQSKTLLDSVYKNISDKKKNTLELREPSDVPKYIHGRAKFLEESAQRGLTDELNSYPATALVEEMAGLRGVLRDLASSSNSHAIDNELSSRLQKAYDEWNEFSGKLITGIKPITLLIDRAGGGKTNLLCDLAVELSNKFPVFFASAKSIVEPTEESILEYFGSSYPISNNPIEYALSISKNENSPVVVFIDGINEHYNPALFNNAFKSFVKKFYGRQVRYVVSCRDIYWRFFEDDWWAEHSEEIAKDELYQFSTNEFRKALPKYLDSFCIDVSIKRNAKRHLLHPLLLRFFCEAYKGVDGNNANLGIINDVYLLPLFDTYCDNKYEQIRKRLHLLTSSDISELVSMLGLMMLKRHNRLLPISDIRKRIEQQFGETNIYSSKSKYVQILDEDIIIEQVPTRSLHQLNVEFVYDEFMEYVIATSLYYQSSEFSGTPSLDVIIELAVELLSQEADFVSVAGIIVFIGTIVAERSRDDGLKFVRFLLKQSRPDLASRILGRWPEKNICDEVADILITLHSEEASQDLKKAIWQTLEDIHWRYWPAIYAYVTHMPMEGFYRRSRVFGFLKRCDGGVTKADRWNSLNWIGAYINIARDTDSGDFRGAISAFKHLVKIEEMPWNKEQLNYIERILSAAPTHRARIS